MLLSYVHQEKIWHSSDLALIYILSFILKLLTSSVTDAYVPLCLVSFKASVLSDMLVRLYCHPSKKLVSEITSVYREGPELLDP